MCGHYHFHLNFLASLNKTQELFGLIMLQVTEECSAGGSPRRCGGQGDVLSGTLATFLHWATMAGDSCPPPGPEILAAWGSARLTRSCAEQAFTNTGRSTTTTDMIGVLHMEFSRLYESETFL